MDFKSGEEVLARWTDCRYYPAKVETLNKEGTYTVQFYDGVIRCVKKMHIKSMPEDAKGQDWIALVKAAAAAATTKNKIQCKPRSSTYSNKDKEEKKGLKVTPKKEAEESTSEAPPPKVQTSEEKSVSPESLVKADILKAEPKSASEVMETAASKKKNSQCSSFQAKRARLNKITGFLASKAVVADSSEKKKGESKVFPPNEQKLPKTECQKQSVNLLSSPQCERANSAITFSSGRSRSRKSKAEPYNLFGSKLKPKSITTIAFSQEGKIKLEPQFPLSETASSGQSQAERHHRILKPNHRHRRYQRSLAVLLEPPLEQVLTSTSSPTGKRLSSNSHTKQEPGFLEVEIAATSLSSQKSDMVLPLDLSKHSKVVMAASPLTPNSKEEVKGQNETKIVRPPSSLTERKTVVSSAAGAVIRGAPTTVKPNRPREPVINTKKTEDFTFTKETVIDLDHNKFKCKVPGCLKAFRKAKLLDYHLKYYHSTNKETEVETGSAGSAVQSHATSVTVPTSTPENQDSKRLRTVSGSSSLSSDSHTIQVEIPLTSNLKLFKSSKKKRSSISLCSDGNDAELSVSVKQTSFASLHEKILKKVTEKNRDMETCVIKSEKKIKLEEKYPSSGKKKEKDKEKKEKKDEAHFKVKQKKKKKKKKKSKQHDYLKYDENSLDFLDKCSHPQSLGNSVVHRNIFQMKNSSCQYPRAILSVDLTGENLSDVEFLDDSSTESLLLSGDEYNQDFDSTNLEDSQDEENTTHEIVRCVCDMDEENGFMIQCEECLCWQHSTCMGLLEETIPERYVCYICRDPTGQRWSAKYKFDKDWLNKGHLYGLSFLNENYSHQNAKKIIATHHLLADVYSAAEILHSLKLKIGILQSNQHSDLHFWACSGLQTEEASVRLGIGKGLLTFQEKVNCPEYNDSYKVQFNPVLKAENNYITSEHSYQKPHVYTQDHRPFIDPASSDDEDDSSSLDDEHGIYFHASKRQQELHSVKQRHLTEQDAAKELPLTSDNNYERSQVEKQGDSYLQWQLNLLTHIENVQNEVTTRIELIEKEVDVLESWLDFTGELEPPEPLARLPQLKRRIKQLLADLGKVQQMATLCPV